MPKLFVLGDSFSFPHETKEPLWPIITAKHLSEKLGEPVEVVNESVIGVGQDFVWKKLDSVLQIMTPEDFLVIVLTSCNRFWVLENHPEYSNLMSVENISHVTQDPELQAALLGFINRIWRHSLASQFQNHRLGFLSYYVLKNNLRAPVILKGFENDIDNEDKFPELNFSNHSLAKVQLEEFEKFDGLFNKGDILMDPKYWHHVDCRYNHLCLSNHKVLSEMLSGSLLSGNPVDLGSDKFYKNIITEKNCKDKDFASKEFHPRYFDEMISNSLRQKLGAKSFKLRF